jgi:hypothetical protein
MTMAAVVTAKAKKKQSTKWIKAAAIDSVTMVVAVAAEDYDDKRDNHQTITCGAQWATKIKHNS